MLFANKPDVYDIDYKFKFKSDSVILESIKKYPDMFSLKYQCFWSIRVLQFYTLETIYSELQRKYVNLKGFQKILLIMWILFLKVFLIQLENSL